MKVDRITRDFSALRFPVLCPVYIKIVIYPSKKLVFLAASLVFIFPNHSLSLEIIVSFDIQRPGRVVSMEAPKIGEVVIW